jgi:hypothetical protein
LIGFCLLATVAFAAPSPLAAAPLPAADAALTVDIGFGGVFQVGRWTPVRLTVAEGRMLTAASATIADVDGRPVTYPLQVDGSHAEGLMQSGRLDAAVRIAATMADGSSLERLIPVGGAHATTCLRQDTELWLLIGRQIGFERAAEQLNAGHTDASRPAAINAQTIDAARLPTEPAALDGVQLLVLDRQRLAPEQSHAIRDWVQRGGRLVVTAGHDAADLSAPPLPDWLPATVGPVYQERQTTALTGKVTAWVPNRGALRSLNALELVELQPGSGVSILDGPTLPLVVQAGLGLGTVTVVALNLDAPPFVLRTGAATEDRPATWGGLPQMCLQLAGKKTGTAENISSERELQLNPTGVSDLYSQFAGILDDFPGLDRTSNWNVIGLMLVYLLVVGPLDYFVVHRLLKRPQLTWMTLPLWVLLAGWWATSMAAARNGDALLTRQFDVLDIAVDTGTHRLTSWLSLYSPQTRRYSVSYQPVVAPGGPADVRIAPVGRPEAGFRGMYRRGGLNLGGAGYEIHSAATTAVARQAPVDESSSLAFTGTAVWTQPFAEPLATCRMLHDDRGNFIRFELTHHLPGDIEDWFAVDQLQASFPLRNNPDSQRLCTGQTYNLLLSSGQKLLRSFLQGEVTLEQKHKTGSSIYIGTDEYDPLSLNPARLFRVLSFHDAIGGPSFTRLENRTLDRLDFSPVIQLNRLIVCGRLKGPASNFTLDDAAPQAEAADTFVRLIVPIVRETVPSVPLRVPPRD